MFLGHRISAEGIEANPELTKVVQEWPQPQNVKDMQSFLGLTNYYRRFIDKYSEIAEPLFQLTKKGVKFHWEAEQQKAFEVLKEKLVSPPVLAYPLAQNTFILDTDASNHSIGAVLSQLQGDSEKVISYASKRLGPTQSKYCVTRKELLAIVTFTQKFRHYLLGRQFIVRTDHGSLTWLYRFKTPQGQLARWLEHLSQFDIVFQHRKGVNHGNADALSRYPLKGPHCDCYSIGSRLCDLPCGGCTHCAKIHQEWSRFHTDVDDVIPLAVKSDVGRPFAGHQTSHGDQCCDDSDPGSNNCYGGHSVPKQRATIETIRNLTQMDDAVSDDEDEIGPPISLSKYTNEELSQKQKDDPELRKLFKWMEGKFPSDREEMFAESPALKHFWLTKENLSLSNNCLYYRWTFPEETRLLFIVPEAMKKEIIDIAHCSP